MKSHLSLSVLSDSRIKEVDILMVAIFISARLGRV